jgi:hypothetical protein
VVGKAHAGLIVAEVGLMEGAVGEGGLNDVGREGAARDARRADGGTAGGRNGADEVGAVGEIDISDVALTVGEAVAVDGPHGDVPAQADIDGQAAVDLDLVLDEESIDPAQTAYYFDPYFKTPYTDQWNLQVEQGFGSTMVFTFGYVGSHSSRLDLGGLYNTARFPGAGDAATVASRRQFPYITPTNYDKSSGNANFNAFEASLKKSTSNGLTYLISYTSSKAIDLASSGSFGVEGTLLQDPYNPQHDRSVSGFDLRNNFSASVNYELPIGRGKKLSIENPILSSLFGGWLLNSIVTLHSGSPFSVTENGDIANTGNTFVEADLIGNTTPRTRSAKAWFNTAAFTSPAAGTFGNSGRNSLLSNRYNDVDFSAFKSFALPHETAIQFRAEAFNLFNNVVFAAPDSILGDPNFGSVSATSNTPRQLRFALKLTF